LRQQNFIKVDFRYSGRPPKLSLLNASELQIGVLKPVCVVAATVVLEVQARRSTSSPSI
jgi:hypothetical protein